MNQNNNQRRGNRGGARRGNRPRAGLYSSVFDDARLRGTAQQIADKYIELSKTDEAEDNREQCLQHADHWGRVAAEKII